MAIRTTRTPMSTAAAIVLATALAPGIAPTLAVAQGANPVVGSMIPAAAEDTIYAKIQAIDPQTRQVTLAAANGSKVAVIAAAQVPLDTLQVGDTVNAHYYRSVAFLVSKSMQVPAGQATQLPAEQAQLLAQHAQAQTPDGVSMPMTQISGLIVGVRPSANMVDVVNPTGGGVYTIQGDDPSRGAMLSSLRIGDLVTAVVSPPIATSIKPEKGFFANLFG